uniref:Col_cuticle_N domain-containing protein n=1 Tax=Pristionchus pacificus TaxID=54126 RepID=A0A8R1UFK6_PRIPA
MTVLNYIFLLHNINQFIFYFFILVFGSLVDDLRIERCAGKDREIALLIAPFRSSFWSQWTSCAGSFTFTFVQHGMTVETIFLSIEAQNAYLTILRAIFIFSWNCCFTDSKSWISNHFVRVASSSVDFGGNRVFSVLLIVCYSIPSGIFCAIPQKGKEIAELNKSDPRNIFWISERGCYFYGIWEPILLTLNRKKSNRSIRNTRKFVKILADKLSFTPLLIMAIPVTIIYTATAFDGLLSFEQSSSIFNYLSAFTRAQHFPSFANAGVSQEDSLSSEMRFEECLTVFSVWYFHSFVRNIFLLLLTPAYRKKIVFLVKCIGNCSYSQSARVCEVRSIGKENCVFPGNTHFSVMTAREAVRLLVVVASLPLVDCDTEGVTDVRPSDSPTILRHGDTIDIGKFIEEVTMQLSQNFSAVDVTLPPENLRLREGAMIEIGKFIDKVAAPYPANQSDCNSERLRASISENTTLAIQRILKRIDDGQFVANCTFRGVPEVDRREQYCQLTKGSTTCALSTGRRPDPPGIELHVPEFTPPPTVIAVPGDGGEMSHIVLTFGSHAPVPSSVTPGKIRSHGSARRLMLSVVSVCVTLPMLTRFVLQLKRTMHNEIEFCKASAAEIRSEVRRLTIALDWPHNPKIETQDWERFGKTDEDVFDNIPGVRITLETPSVRNAKKKDQRKGKAVTPHDSESRCNACCLPGRPGKTGKRGASRATRESRSFPSATLRAYDSTSLQTLPKRTSRVSWTTRRTWRCRSAWNAWKTRALRRPVVHPDPKDLADLPPGKDGKPGPPGQPGIPAQSEERAGPRGSGSHGTSRASRTARSRRRTGNERTRLGIKALRDKFGSIGSPGRPGARGEREICPRYCALEGGAFFDDATKHP